MKKTLITISIGLAAAFVAPVSAMAMTAPAHPAVQAVKVVRPLIFHATITVPQEVDQVSKETPAQSMGTAAMLFNPKTDVLHFTITYSGMSSAPFMAHFHYGMPTTNGPIQQTICGKPAPTIMGACPDHNYGVMHGAWKLNAKEVHDLLTGQFYINLHTKLNPNGEIRGQVIPGV